MPSTNDLHRTLDAGVHLWIAGCAVSTVMVGLILTTGWRY